MAIMCNLTHDVCSELEMLENTGALEHVFSQVRPLLHVTIPRRHAVVAVEVGTAMN